MRNQAAPTCALVLGTLILLGFGVGCNPALPEPDSPAAQLYVRRCGGCHRLYDPHVLKFPMWEVTIQRMQGEMARRGVAPLSGDERALLLEYLRRYSG